MAKMSPLSGVRKWLDRDEWRQPFAELLRRHLGATCKAAGIQIDDLPDVIGEDRASNLFGCIFEDLLATELADGSNIVDDYLKRRGWKEPVPNKRYMMALRSSVMSLYEVSDIVRGQSFLARDLFRGGDPVRVSEIRAAGSMKPWDVLAARIVKVGSKWEVAGGALPLERKVGATLSEGFVALREKMRAEVQGSREPGSAELDPYALDTEVLRTGAILFTQVWLGEILRQVLDPTSRELVNADGDRLEPTTVTYPLKPEADRTALADGLTAVPAFHPTLDGRWDWLGPGGALAPGSEAEQGADYRNFLPEGSVTRGCVELGDDTLTLNTNSPQRAEKMRALLDPVIGPFVGEAVVTTVAAEEFMPGEPGDAEPSRFGSIEEERLYLRRSMERHYRGLLDKPVQASGDASPREAAKSTEGRERLAGWLKGVENTNARVEPDYDISWLWEELGVSDPRR
jgi:hypothetical protein